MGHGPTNERSIISHDEFVPDVSDTAVKLLITEHNHKFENRIRDILAEAKVSKDICARVISKHREKESLKQQMRSSGDAESTITLEKEPVDEVILPPIPAVPWNIANEQRSTRPPSVNRQRGPEERPRGRPTTRSAKEKRVPPHRNVYEKFQQDLADDERRKETGALQNFRAQTPQRDFFPLSPRIDRYPLANDQPQPQRYEDEDQPINYNRVGPAESMDATSGRRNQKAPPQPTRFATYPAEFDDRPFHVDTALDQERERHWSQDIPQAPAPPALHNMFDPAGFHDQERHVEPEPRRPAPNPMDSHRSKYPSYEHVRVPHAQTENPGMFSERVATKMDEYDRWKLTWLEGEMRALRRRASHNSGGGVGGGRVLIDERTGQYYYESEIPISPPSPYAVEGIQQKFSKPPVVDVADAREYNTVRPRNYTERTVVQERFPLSEAEAKWRMQSEQIERQRANPRDYWSGSR